MNEGSMTVLQKGFVEAGVQAVGRATDKEKALQSFLDTHASNKDILGSEGVAAAIKAIREQCGMPEEKAN